MGIVTIINATPYKKQPVPEIGVEYHIFDDGKINFSRHYLAEVVEVIPFDECKNKELIAAWKENVSQCFWLYDTTTDYFVKAISDFDEHPLYFVRTKDGGCFSINYPNDWMSARLDSDGSLYNELINDV